MVAYIDRDKVIWAVIALATITGIAGMSWFGYSWYKKTQEESAHRVFAETIQEIKSRGQSEEIIGMIDEALSRYKGSVLYPFFLSYKADTLVAQGDSHEKALDAMKRAVESLSQMSPFYHMYQLKYALMLADSPDDSDMSHARQILESLSTDASGNTKHEALYYLGFFSFKEGDSDKAESYWQKMISQKDVHQELMNKVRMYAPLLHA
jgi:hypothetical protein